MEQDKSHSARPRSNFFSNRSNNRGAQGQREMRPPSFYRRQHTQFFHNRRQQNNFANSLENTRHHSSSDSTTDRRTHAVLSSSLPSMTLFRAESDLPGFSYDPVTKKYYKILPNKPGQPVGSTQRDLKAFKKQHELNLKAYDFELNANIVPTTSSMMSLPRLLRNIEMGYACSTFSAPSTKRHLEECRLRRVHQTPNYNFDIIDSASGVGRFAGCQFLDVKEDGKTLIGCWSVSGVFGLQSRIVSYKIGVDSMEAQKNSRLRQQEELPLDSQGKCSLNTYGLHFEPVENEIFVESALVDMLLAPADSDVTCIVYATANSFFASDHRIMTSCRVFLKPVDHLTNEEGKESMTSPIYNAEWRTNEPIWSCSFNSNHMRIGIGMEKYATIFDVLTDQCFKVSSGGRNVIAQQYSKEGDLLYLGRRNANISSLDLRMSNHHTVGEFLDSNSTCFIHRLENRPNFILTDNFDGKLKLWDTRARRSILSFYGHKNKSHKVPCFVDDNERFIFAVGEDGIARGWSLNSGELLCSVVCPKSRIEENLDFPRIVYSNCWGGVNGNSAILLACNGEIQAHELLF